MILTPESVELLAPVGTWDVLEAAVEAGANAVYLGGKRFNMRMHRTDCNFDDQKLAQAIEYAHANNVKLYVTVNNLISSRELDNMRDYLKLLNQIQPDALIVQDLAILELAKEIGLTVPLHASVMMNTHNEHAVRSLQDYGITRVVVSREMTLTQIRLLRERTGIEVEYFIHGDMCISQSGQCYHSGVLFGQSSNRGRCLKPCRWPFKLIDADTRQEITDQDPGPYKLALKDMCLYRYLPELIQSGVCSFKIEGRMRTADFVRRIVKAYRSAIDRYITDPTGYTTDEQGWQDIFEGRARDFSPCYALGNPGAGAIGYTGEREPRFFSQAVKEADLNHPVVMPSTKKIANDKRSLAVRVADLAGLSAACKNGADIVYVGGEAFAPSVPWSLTAIEHGIVEAQKYNTKVVVTTPRIAMERECGEYEQFFSVIDKLKPAGLMVSNVGMLRLAKALSALPVQTDFSFNVFNHVTTAWLKANGATKATISVEATLEQITAMAQQSPLPLELIVHGAIEAMILDHSIPAAVTGKDQHDNYQFYNSKQYALLDSADQQHLIKIDQYGRNHILFAKDLCLLPFLGYLPISNFRIEGQHYSAKQVGMITNIYRQELDKIAANTNNYQFSKSVLDELSATSPRELGIGAFRYRVSR